MDLPPFLLRSVSLRREWRRRTVSYEGRRWRSRKKRTELGDFLVVGSRGSFELLVVILLLSEHLVLLEGLEEPVGLEDPAALQKRSDEKVSSALLLSTLANGRQNVAHLVVGIILSLVFLVGSLDVFEQAGRSRGFLTSPVEEQRRSTSARFRPHKRHRTSTPELRGDQEVRRHLFEVLGHLATVVDNQTLDLDEEGREGTSAAVLDGRGVELATLETV